MSLQTQKDADAAAGGSLEVSLVKPVMEVSADGEKDPGNEPVMVVSADGEKDPDNDPAAGWIAWAFPKSYRHSFGIVFLFGVLLVATTVSQGLSYGRFETRSLQCYDVNSYYKKIEGGCSGDGDGCQAHTTNSSCMEASGCTWTPGTRHDPNCKPFSYPYRLTDPKWWTRLLPWIGYLFHQFGQWWFLWKAQRARDRGEISWTLQKDLVGKTDVEKRAAYAPNRYAQGMFALNMGMTLLKFLQAQIFYDGLATDVPEFSALYSVALWIFFVLVIEMPRRGLLCGRCKDFDCLKHKCDVGTTFITFVRKYHGYGISFGTTYNYWYHPMEGSPGFVLGYLYQFCMILQSGFLFHPLHRNKFWTLLLELGMIPHAVITAVFFANGGSGQTYQFGFGFSLLFLLTQMHGFDLKLWQKTAFVVVYVGLLFGTYLLTERPISDMVEVARMSANFMMAPIGWCLWSIGALIVQPCKNSLEQYPKAHGIFWLAIWLAQMILFVVMGPTE